jgi:hypothetical protein
MQKEPTNKNRFLVEALRAIAAEHRIEFSSFSHDWIIRLHRDNTTRYVYGYNFDLNSATSALIANDKSALSAVLEQYSIPHVEHTLFLAPKLSEYTDPAGKWLRAIRYAEKTGFPIVCKTNNGTGGDDVFKVNNQSELEALFQNVHTSSVGLTLSPYYAIEKEYRIVLLNGLELLCYEKERPHLLGDGQSTFFELLKKNDSCEPRILNAALNDPVFPLNEIPDQGSKIPIIWKHNLGKGATPLFLITPEVRKNILELARAVCAATKIQFASIDVIQTVDDGMKIMEVNAGIMLENLSRFSSEGYALAFKIYASAVTAMFDLKNQN